MRKAIFAVLIGGAAAAAWSEPPAALAICHKAAVGQCFEYRKHDAQSLGYSKAACDARAGHVWSEGKACPTEKRIAHCSLDVLGAVTLSAFYPPATMKEATAHCALFGLKVVPN
jgi:hypothetical protein